MPEQIFGALEQAIHETVNGYVDPGTRQRGAVALAPRLGMRPATLSNKANPLCEHELKLSESIPLQLIAVNFSILHAYASALGHCAVRLPDSDQVGDTALLDAYCSMHAELGEFAEDMRQALADNRVSADEIARMRKAFDSTVRAGLSVLHRVRFDRARGSA
jgi:hypothetical protein